MCKKLCAKVVCEGWCDEKWEKMVEKNDIWKMCVGDDLWWFEKDGV